MTIIGYLILPLVSSILLPPAPYHYKLNCLSGSNGRSLISCPSTSTACGYFEYEGEEDIQGVFSCVDESSLNSGVLAPSGESQLLVVCGPVPGCVFLPPHSISSSIVNSLHLNTSRPIHFCCSTFHHNLLRLAKDVSFIPPEPRTIECGEEDCMTGAVGCMVTAKTKEQLRDMKWRRKRERQWEGVKAVQVSFNNEDDQYMEEEESSEIEEEYIDDSSDEIPITSSSCVYRHLHDELYKYCLLVHSKKDQLKCTSHLGMTICCCFVHPGQSSCDPLRVIPPKTIPTIQPRTTTISPSTTTVHTTTTGSTTTVKTIVKEDKKEMTKCNITYEKQLGGKRRPKVVCSSFHPLINLLILLPILRNFH